MSERMDMISKDALSIFKSEETIIDNIQRKKFFDVLKECGYTYERLKVIFESEMYTNETQNDLNITLRKIKKSHGLHLSDSVVFLEEFTRIKKILYFLDGESKWIIKNELSDKYNIEFETNELFKMLS